MMSSGVVCNVRRHVAFEKVAKDSPEKICEFQKSIWGYIELASI